MMRSQAGRAEGPRRPPPQQTQRPPADEVRIPHDVVNEQVLLAAAIVDRAARKKLLATVPPDSFYGRGHAEAWKILGELERRGLEYDPATVLQLSAGAVDANYLDQLAGHRPESPPNLMHHVEMLQWDRARVEAVRGPIGALLDSLRDPTTEAEKVRAHARQVAVAFEGFGVQRYLRDPSALVREQVAAIEVRRGGRACYPYGLNGLDRYREGEQKAGEWRLIPGAAPGKITVVTGLSGGGKTTVTAQIALAQFEAGRRVLYGAWEQGSGDMLELLASFSLGISRARLAVGDCTPEEVKALGVEMDRIAGGVRFLELPFGRAKGEKSNNDRNLDFVHQSIADSACDVFVADLWRRCLRQFEPDEEEHALYRQQAIAQETNAHCILVHQQRLKDLEQRQDKRPTREGLKGSGAWVEVADTILGVHRPALWKSIPDVQLEVDVLKQRYGAWPLAVEFDWEPETGTVTNGRAVPYDQPGQGAAGGIDEWTENLPAKKYWGRGGGRRAMG